MTPLILCMAGVTSKTKSSNHCQRAVGLYSPQVSQPLLLMCCNTCGTAHSLADEAWVEGQGRVCVAVDWAELNHGHSIHRVGQQLKGVVGDVKMLQTCLRQIATKRNLISNTAK